jgi:uncharacterized membrane protein YccC
VSAFLTSFLRAVSPSWAVFRQTVLLATVYDILSTLDVETVDVRILETAAGAIVAILVSAVLLPTRTRDRVMQGTAEVARRAQDVPDDLFARLLGNPTSEPSIEAQT